MDEEKEYKFKFATHQLEVFKFLVTGLILGVATFVSTCTFKSYELKIQARKAESENLKPYLDKYLELVQKDSLRYDRALDMATFVYYTSTDDEIKCSWLQFKTYLEWRLNAFTRTSDSIKLATKKADSTLMRQHVAYSAAKARSITDVNYRKTSFKSDSVNLVKAIDSVSVQIAEANVKQRELTTEARKVIAEPKSYGIDVPVASKTYEVIYDLNRWAGEGYQNQIVDGITVYIDEFIDGNRRVSLRVGWSDGSFNDYKVNVGELIEAKSKDENYKVTIRILVIKNMGNKVFGALNKEASYRIKVERRKDTNR